MRKNRKRIFVRAYLKKNLGDDLFVKILSERYQNEKFKIVSKCNYKNMFNSNVKDFSGRLFDFINKSIQFITLKRYSLIQLFIKLHAITIWIGGSIFIENNKSDKSTIKMKPRKKYYILGANFGPYRTQEYFDVAKETLKNAQDVCFRESFSYNTFKDLSNVRMAPDLVFNLDTSNIHIKNSKKVVISIINCRTRFSTEIYNMYENKIIELCQYFIRKKYEVVLMSFCKLEGDEVAIESILSKIDKDYKENITTYFYRGNINAALEVIGDCEIVIGSRFHANILGILLNKTVIPISYSNKTSNYLQDIDFKGKYIKIQDIEKFDVNNLTEEEINYKYDATELIKDAGKHFEKLDEILQK